MPEQEGIRIEPQAPSRIQGVEILSTESAPPERSGPLTDAIERLRAEVATEGEQPESDVELDSTDLAAIEPEPEQEQAAQEPEPADLDKEPEATAPEAEPEAEKTEEVAEAEAEYTEIELPEALREQGVDSIEVPKDQERLFRTLTKGYMRRTEAEAEKQKTESAQRELREFEESLQNDWVRSAGHMIAAPMDFLVKYAKAEPQEILDEIKLYLAENPEQLDDMIDWHARVTGDDREMKIEQRTLAQRRQDRVREVQRREGDKWEYKQVALKLDREIDRLAAGLPDHLKPRVVQLARQELHNEALRRAGAGGSALIRPDEVKNLVGWLIEPHTPKETRETETGEQEQPQTPEKQTEQPRDRFAKRLEKRKAGIPRPAAGPLIQGGPKKGMLLDQVLESLKGG